MEKAIIDTPPGFTIADVCDADKRATSAKVRVAALNTQIGVPTLTGPRTGAF